MPDLKILYPVRVFTLPELQNTENLRKKLKGSLHILNPWKNLLNNDKMLLSKNIVLIIILKLI